MKRDELIEAMAFARARYVMGCMGWDVSTEEREMAAILTALETALGIDLTAIAEGRAVVVPVECDDYTAEGIWQAAYDEYAEFGSNEKDAGRAAYRAMLAARSAPHDQ